MPIIEIRLKDVLKPSDTEAFQVFEKVLKKTTRPRHYQEGQVYSTVAKEFQIKFVDFNVTCFTKDEETFKQPSLRFDLWQTAAIIGSGSFCSVYDVTVRYKISSTEQKFILTKKYPHVIKASNINLPTTVEKFFANEHRAAKDQRALCAYQPLFSLSLQRFYLEERKVVGRDLIEQGEYFCSLPLLHQLRVIIKAALALENLHLRGIVHRDVKPDNLLVSFANPQNPVVTLIDFGFSVCREQGEGNISQGTPGYVSPEACEGIANDEQSDTFSFARMVAGLFGDADFFHDEQYHYGSPYKFSAEKFIVLNGKMAPESLDLLVSKLNQACSQDRNKRLSLKELRQSIVQIYLQILTGSYTRSVVEKLTLINTEKGWQLLSKLVEDNAPVKFARAINKNIEQIQAASTELKQDKIITLFSALFHCQYCHNNPLFKSELLNLLGFLSIEFADICKALVKYSYDRQIFAGQLKFLIALDAVCEQAGPAPKDEGPSQRLSY